MSQIKLLNKKSNVLGKIPTQEQLDYGELAINYNSENPKIYIKDSSNNIVHFERLISGKTIKTINGKNLIGSGDIVISGGESVDIDLSIESCTYEYLVELINNSSLIPNKLYRITDYVTTTVQENTQSANHQFDIIVKALSNKILSEDASVMLNDGDTYFAECDLNAWEIKYCFNNDTTRFAWADTSNGKGVIYYMKDEFNNECWYDFKNIQFLRTAQWFKDNPNFVTQFLSNTYFYTFSVVDNGVIKDDTLYTINYHATDNHLGRNTAKITKLNNTIFIDKPNNGVFNNIIADGHGNNTFGQSIWNNTIAHNCLNNIINNNFQYNDISPNFKDNHSWGNFAYNTIESGCVNNRFLGNVNKCTFKQAYSNNNFTGETLSQCTFGSNNNWISDMPSMTNVTFGNNCVTSTTSIYLNNLRTINGDNLLSLIQGFNTKFEYTILLTDNDKYCIYSHNIINKISNIYDLGSFGNSGSAEDVAKNPNIGTNANITLMKYYVPSVNKTGIIEQMVGSNETTQIITWDGLRKFRKLQYQNIGGNMSLINNPSWEEIKFITLNEWNNLNEQIISLTLKLEEIAKVTSFGLNLLENKIN